MGGVGENGIRYVICNPREKKRKLKLIIVLCLLFSYEAIP